MINIVRFASVVMLLDILGVKLLFYLTLSFRNVMTRLLLTRSVVSTCDEPRE